ncbi:MAG: SPFH domain-containing protein [Candidatus Eisenbacteria bacterium]|uniref:SPFH domain-containing protein n=1 Tax=Eiseniibacteriota bacterium TaxID=2212470 RepID=A0A538TS09_UNCEI|nr:MAG: SPFH domain-containing protein [Candidatus Eisenbacteria bacterium]
MGLVSKLRGELVDIVEWIDDTRNTLVRRFPRYQNEIKNGARLVVRPGQSAIFVDQGRVADVFQPGTYELITKNLPALTTLRGWKHGFSSPFKAEVYFVTTRQITELKWGTPHPVLLRDPEFGPLRVRAFGTYTLRAAKPEALLSELVGTDGSFEADEIEVLLRSIVASEFSKMVASTEISVVDLASNYARLSEDLRRAVLDRIDDAYGLDLPQLFIVNISVPEQVERALDARSSMDVLGDLNRYQQYQLGSSIPTAAANPAGGLAGAGVGLGMGMSIAGLGAAGAAKPPLPLIPPTPDSDPAIWHVASGGRTFGPYSVAQLGLAVSAGQLTGESFVWTAGMEAWAPIGRVPRLAVLLAPPPPPPPAA